MLHKICYAILIITLLLVSIGLERYIEWTNRVYYIAPVTVVKGDYIMTKTLDAIGYCESGSKQFDSYGNLIRGIVNHFDVGEYQINENYHLKEAEKLGIDIHTLDGNRKYAEYLYHKNGTKDWKASQPCWENMI